MPGLNRILGLLLISSGLQGCLMINYSSKESSYFWLLLPGFLLLFFALQKVWKHAGNAEVPAWIRFLHGLAVGISIFLA